MWILTACVSRLSNPQKRSILRLQITFLQFNIDLYVNGRKRNGRSMGISIEGPSRAELMRVWCTRSAKSSSSYSYLLPAEAGVANWYRAIMLAIAPDNLEIRKSRRFYTMCSSCQISNVTGESSERASGIVKRKKRTRKSKRNLHSLCITVDFLFRERNFDCRVIKNDT